MEQLKSSSNKNKLGKVKSNVLSDSLTLNRHKNRMTRGGYGEKSKGVGRG